MLQLAFSAVMVLNLLWFSMAFPYRHAEVVVKMKFKNVPVTVAPFLSLGALADDKPLWANQLHDLLAAI